MHSRQSLFCGVAVAACLLALLAISCMPTGLSFGGLSSLLTGATGSTDATSDATGDTTGDAGTADDSDDGSTESVDSEFTIYSNPVDSLLLSAETADGGYLEVFGERDTEGLPTTLTEVRYQTDNQVGTDDATWLSFDEEGDLALITGEDGSTIGFAWTSATTAVLTAVSADGAVQVETEIDLAEPEAARNAPATRSADSGVAARDGRHLELRVVESAAESSTAKSLRQPPALDTKHGQRAADSSADKVYVQVLRCGASVDGAFVSVSLDNPYNKMPATYTAWPTGTAGEYVATVPVIPASTAGETAQDICNSLEGILGHGCNLAKISQGQETSVCVALAAAIDLALAGPTGEGVPILAACEAGFAALKAYCDTLGASATDGSPSIAAHFICGNIKSIVDRAVRDPASDLSLQAWVNAKGLPPARSTAQTVPPTGPFPSLTVEFPNTGPIVHPILLTPADPAPGEFYMATVRVECVPPDSWVTLSVAGTDGYSDSTSAGVNGEATLELIVPGALQGVSDLIMVQVGGVSQLQAAVVF